MRVSVFPDDPGYDPSAVGSKVFYCGSERKYVFTADEEKRLIVAASLNANGKVVVENGEVKKETLYGDVRVELPDRDKMRAIFGDKI